MKQAEIVDLVNKFKLVSKKKINDCIKFNLDKYKSDQAHLYVKNQMQQLLPFLNDGEKSLNGQNIIKYFAHFYEITGEFQWKDFKSIDGEGWEQGKFLVIHLYTLLKKYSEVQNPDLQVPIPIPKVVAISAIENEIWVTTNTLAICYMRDLILSSEPGHIDGLLKLFIKNFLSSLEQNFKDLKEAKEFCFSCGFSTHAIYLAFFRFRNELLLRLDNIGKIKDSYLFKLGYKDVDIEKRWQWVVAKIGLDELSSEALQEYLVEICKQYKQAWDSKGFDLLYDVNTKSRFRKPIEFKKAFFPPSVDHQGHCVMSNFLVGAYFRLWNICPDMPNIFFEWLFGETAAKALEIPVVREDTLLHYMQDVRKQEFDQLIKSTQISPRLREKINIFTSSMPFFREEFFIERPNEIHTFLEKFGLNENKHHEAILLGQTGTGKTQLALYYFNKYKEHYQLRVWFPVSGLENAFRSFRNIIFPNLNINDSIEIVRHDVINWFNNHSDWLIVFDGASSYDEIKDYLPHQGIGDIIITAEEDDNFNQLSKPIVIPSKLELSLAKGIFKQYTNEKEKKMAWDEIEEKLLTELIQNLGAFPLAVAQAAAYVANTPEATLNTYLKQYYKTFHKTNLIGVPSFEATFKISLKKIKKRQPLAYKIFKCCAYLANSGIPYNLLEKILANLKLSIKQKKMASLKKSLKNLLGYFNDSNKRQEIKLLDKKDDLSLNEILKVLTKLFMVEYSENLHSMNIQKLAQTFITKQDESMFRQKIFKSRLKPVGEALCSFYPFKDKFSLDYIGVRNLKPHLENIIHQFESIFPEKLRKKSSEKANLYWRLRIALNDLNLNVLGERTQQVLKSEEEIFAMYAEWKTSDQEFMAKRWDNLGYARWIVSSHPDHRKSAIFAHQQALKIREQLYPKKDNPNLAISYDYLGNIYSYSEELKPALNHYSEAVAIYEKYPSKHREDLAGSYHNLATVYEELGKQNCVYINKAIYFYEKAREIFLEKNRDNREQKETGQKNPDLIICSKNLGEAYAAAGRMHKSMQILTETLQLANNLYAGDPHPILGYCYTSMGNIYYSFGNLQQARKSFEKAFEIQKHCDRENPKSIELAACHKRLGNIYRALGEFKKAREEYEMVLAIRKADADNEERIDVTLARDDLATTYNIDKPKETLAMHRKMLKVLENYYQQPHIAIATCWARMGDCCQKHGRG